MSNSADAVCNEVILQTGERRKITLGIILRNEYFLNVVSLCFFFGVWHWAAASQILGSSSALATPAEVVAKLGELFNSTLAGLTMWGHIAASLKRVIFGFLVAAVIGVPLGLVMALFPYVMPASNDPANSLTIANASSTQMTLEIMSRAALVFLPLVLAYQAWTYWVFRKRVTRTMIEKAEASAH